MNTENMPKISPQIAAHAKDYTCDSCGNNFFVPVFQLKRISALVSPNGKEINFPVQTFGCVKCGHVNESFIPKLNESGLTE